MYRIEASPVPAGPRALGFQLPGRNPVPGELYRAAPRGCPAAVVDVLSSLGSPSHRALHCYTISARAPSLGRARRTNSRPAGRRAGPGRHAGAPGAAARPGWRTRKEAITLRTGPGCVAARRARRGGSGGRPAARRRGDGRRWRRPTSTAPGGPHSAGIRSPAYLACRRRAPRHPSRRSSPRNRALGGAAAAAWCSARRLLERGRRWPSCPPTPRCSRRPSGRPRGWDVLPAGCPGLFRSQRTRSARLVAPCRINTTSSIAASPCILFANFRHIRGTWPGITHQATEVAIPKRCNCARLRAGSAVKWRTWQRW